MAAEGHGHPLSSEGDLLLALNVPLGDRGLCSPADLPAVDPDVGEFAIRERVQFCDGLMVFPPVRPPVRDVRLPTSDGSGQ